MLHYDTLTQCDENENDEKTKHSTLTKEREEGRLQDFHQYHKKRRVTDTYRYSLLHQNTIQPIVYSDNNTKDKPKQYSKTQNKLVFLTALAAISFT